MSELATQARFENGGTWYSQYRNFPFFAQRAAWINQAAPTGKVLVAGCGWGFLVDELMKLERDAWGIDAAAYCVAKAPEVLPAASAARVSQRSALVRSDLNAARSAAGLAGNSKFAVGVTEDLLPCLTEAEISTALTELRRACTTLLHIVTPNDQLAPSRVPEMGWRRKNDWKLTVGAEPVYDAETGQVL